MGQIGSMKIQTPSGSVQVPLFEVADVSYPVLRVQTSSGVGAINLVDPVDADLEQVRIQTASGLKAVSTSIGVSTTWTPGATDSAPLPAYDDTGITVEGDGAWGGGSWKTAGNYMDYGYSGPDQIELHFDMTYNRYDNADATNDRGNHFFEVYNTQGNEIFRLWRDGNDGIRYIAESTGWEDERGNSHVLWGVSNGTTYDVRVVYNESGNNRWKIYQGGSLEVTVGDYKNGSYKNDPIGRLRIKGYRENYSSSGGTELRIDYKSNAFIE